MPEIKKEEMKKNVPKKEEHKKADMAPQHKEAQKR